MFGGRLSDSDSGEEAPHFTSTVLRMMILIDIGGVGIGDNNVDNLMLMAMIIIIVKRMTIIMVKRMIIIISR